MREKDSGPQPVACRLHLIVGLIAGALGLSGVAAIAGQIAWILFLIGVVLLVVHLARGRRVAP